jgi:WhiB family transcriptional regulator, redox-sensing transcriptional regulator
MSLLGSPAWSDDGLCLEYPSVDWFPEQGKPAAPAKAVCARCLVQRKCLGFALEQGIEWGVWGGSSARERIQLRRAGVTGEMVTRFGAHVVEGRRVLEDTSALDWLRDLLDSA